MKVNYVFIVGVQKGGTTALAGWLVRNGLAAYAVPGTKEPGHFLRFGLTSPLPPPRSDLPLLDASTGYFGNSKVVSRMPEHRARVAVCLRNPLERTWSAYRMMKLITQQVPVPMPTWSVSTPRPGRTRHWIAPPGITHAGNRWSRAIRGPRHGRSGAISTPKPSV